jgi:hypothetical protein
MKKVVVPSHKFYHIVITDHKKLGADFNGTTLQNSVKIDPLFKSQKAGTQTYCFPF